MDHGKSAVLDLGSRQQYGSEEKFKAQWVADGDRLVYTDGNTLQREQSLHTLVGLSRLSY